MANSLGSRQAARGAMAVCVALAAGCATSDDDPPPRVQVAGPTPAEYLAGDAAFATFCETCHGARGTGTDRGPALVHRIYEPNHHGDQAFFLAVRTGVRAHHWRFGDMAPIEGITNQQIADIVQYVRWLQREAGIY